MRSESRSILAIATLLTALAAGAAVAAENLEPEEGVFAGYLGPEPYELVLRRALLEDDHYRLCQLLVVPSFSQESVVYIVEGQDHSMTVVSRAVRKQLWASMLEEMKRTATSNSIRLDGAAQSIALEKIRAAVETHRTGLDGSTASMVLGLCRAVLLRTRYPETPSRGLDGTTYHAGHWIEGAFLAGHTWSPKAGTVTGDFVEMELALQSYADAPEGRRAPAKANLIAKARRLAESLKAPPAARGP